MLGLSLNFFISALILSLIVLLVPNVALEGPVNFVLSVFVLGLMNFLIRPMLLILRGFIAPFELSIMSFILNLLLLNVATGLIDDFDLSALSAALFGGILMMFAQILLDRLDSGRGKVMG